MTTPEILPEKAWYVPENAEFIDGVWRPLGSFTEQSLKDSI